MTPFIGFPDAPPLCELADGGAWEGCERVEGRKTIGCDREGKDEKVGYKREEDG